MAEPAPPLEAEQAEQPKRRGRRRPWFRLFQIGSLALIAGLLALLVWRVTFAERGANLVSAIAAGKRPLAPSFDLPVIWSHNETWPPRLHGGLVGGRLSLAELRGSPVVVNFWASWCIPCKREARRLVASAKEHEGQVAFLGVDIQDFKSDARRFLRHFQTNYVSVRDGDDSTSSDYGLTGVPETYYVDRRGRIVAHSNGEVSRRELEAGLKQAIGGSR